MYISCVVCRERENICVVVRFMVCVCSFFSERGRCVLRVCEEVKTAMDLLYVMPIFMLRIDCHVTQMVVMFPSNPDAFSLSPRKRTGLYMYGITVAFIRSSMDYNIRIVLNIHIIT